MRVSTSRGDSVDVCVCVFVPRVATALRKAGVKVVAIPNSESGPGRRDTSVCACVFVCVCDISLFRALSLPPPFSDCVYACVFVCAFVLTSTKRV